MSKYQPLWEYVDKIKDFPVKIAFAEIERILGSAIDHSFLKYKKELTDYGCAVVKISMKDKTVLFDKI